MWVCDAAGPVNAGDYVTTCTVPGYGALQLDVNGEPDEIMRSCTVAKLTMSCDFDPPMVEVMVPSKDEFGNNILDADGQMTWKTVSNTVVADDGTVTTTTSMEPAYDMRYLAVTGEGDGTTVEFILKEEYEKRKDAGATGLWRAAFLGCTYHCG
jgi:hypothetical protein